MGKCACLRQKVHKVLVVFRSLNKACQKLTESLKKIMYYMWCHSSLEEPKGRISKQSANCRGSMGTSTGTSSTPESYSIPGIKCIIKIIEIASGNWL